ncbi:hypothetical protein GCM10010401_03730 [Rarobacter faecitabidus]|uniref:LytR family transcriptional attenuator n=1 Tax=Rarobacter faecitabidus TaxID=13243 RepID=A0A542ZU39_RARFA|nr:LCP family protein [Rarobacter faecitabidus]TQL63871.1 LytR family transcriptional attenuator [Rarobacter faecitabidus]
MASDRNDNLPPPSFAPRSGRRRPDAADAEIIGSQPAPVEQTRVMPVSPVPGAPKRTGGPRHPDQRTGSPAASRPATRPAQGGRPPQGPRGAGPGGPGSDEPPVGGKPKRRKGRIIAITAIVVVVLLLAWPIGLGIWANGQIQHVDALSSTADEGDGATTYLLAGSDSREETDPDSPILGARTDTILLLTVPKSGTTSLISIPRDTYVDIPDHGPGKINAAFSYGGPPLLVQTVEALTGSKVDAYVEIGFGGVKEVVDAVGGVRLCLDYDVDDKKSKLKWKKGCHTVGGKKALAFSRMRYADPKGDIGRAERQRQVIAAITKEVRDTSLLFNPGQQVSLIKAGTGAIVTDESANIFTLGRLALAFRDANGDDGVTGTPPIKSLDYRPGGVGSTVLLDPDETPGFFENVRLGKLPPGEVGGLE